MSRTTWTVMTTTISNLTETVTRSTTTTIQPTVSFNLANPGTPPLERSLTQRRRERSDKDDEKAKLEGFSRLLLQRRTL